MGMNSRKGYIHALEGVIAALMVVVYLNSIVSTPTTTDWEKTRISKTSEDLLSALDRSGFLDRVMLRDDPASFNAFVNSLQGALSYSIQVSGLPRRFVDVGVMVNNSSTYQSTSAVRGSGGAGIPTSLDGSGYREGTLTNPEFNDLDFVLSDTVDNGIRGYSSVNFDLNGDGDFSDALSGGGETVSEGPYNFSDRFLCDGGFDACSVSETYEVGPFNTTLILYNGSTASELQQKKSETEIGMRTVTLTYQTVNTVHQSVAGFDALWVEDWPVEEIDDYNSSFENFFRSGRMVFIHSPIEVTAIDSNYLSELGFGYIGEYEISGTGPTENVFYSLHGPRNDSYRSSQYYLEGGIRLDGFTDAGGYDEATLEIQRSQIEVRRWPSGEVSFGSESFSVNHSAGDPVSIEGNQYYVDGTTPLVLDPSGQQRFESFGTERINADYHATRMEGRHYNITDEDVSAGFSNEYQNKSDLPEDYEDGPVTTVCDWQDEPYKEGSIEIDSTTYTFILVNFEPTAPCDEYFEFVYFDLNDDGDVDDDDLTDFSQEGPYQRGDVVNVSGNQYQVSPHLDGEGMDLERIGPRLVGEIPVSVDVLGRGGSAAIVRRQQLGHDDMHMITSILARETQGKQRFTAPRALGENSLGHTYTSSAGRENSFGYTIQSVWWFR